MKNNTVTFAAFVIGAAVGAAIAFRYISKRYFAEEEILDNGEPEEENEVTELINKDCTVKEAATKLGYISPENDEDFSDKETIEAPYVISPEEFGEYGYETVSLTYYADGVLTDDNDEPIDDINEIIGIESLNHFGEYEDDIVYVRNDARKSDYEVLKDLNNYAYIQQ